MSERRVQCIDLEMDHLKQQTSTKFCQHLSKLAREMLLIHQMVYSKQMMPHSKMFDWYHRFKDYQESLQDNRQSRQPATSWNKTMPDRCMRLYTLIVIW
jgi:hypothetical protein